MVKEAVWSISLQRAQDFFRAQADVQEESPVVFWLSDCRITLTELPPRGTGIWSAKQMRLCIEGESAGVEAIYHRFFLQFLSTGG